MKKNVKGFALEYILFAVVVIVVAAVAVTLALTHHKKNTNSAAGKTGSSSQSTQNTSSNTQSTDPYAGWKTATLQYEQANFKYPASWTLSNSSKANGLTGTVSPGSDTAMLTSPTGLKVTFDTGVYGIGDGFRAILDSQAISTLGGNYYLDFYTDIGQSNAFGACIGTTSTDQAMYPDSKNINVTNSSTKPHNVVCLKYLDGEGNPIEKPVSSFKADNSYGNAILIVKSLAY